MGILRLLFRRLLLLDNDKSESCEEGEEAALDRKVVEHFHRYLLLLSAGCHFAAKRYMEGDVPLLRRLLLLHFVNEFDFDEMPPAKSN